MLHAGALFRAAAEKPQLAKPMLRAPSYFAPICGKPQVAKPS
jgi:hypothetical protein